MKSIDIKSIIIGALLTSTIFLGVAASVPKDTGKIDVSPWDEKQGWTVTRVGWLRINGIGTEGYQPFAVDSDDLVYYRKRVK